MRAAIVKKMRPLKYLSRIFYVHISGYLCIFYVYFYMGYFYISEEHVTTQLIYYSMKILPP